MCFESLHEILDNNLRDVREAKQSELLADIFNTEHFERFLFVLFVCLFELFVLCCLCCLFVLLCCVVVLFVFVLFVFVCLCCLVELFGCVWLIQKKKERRQTVKITTQRKRVGNIFTNPI